MGRISVHKKVDKKYSTVNLFLFFNLILLGHVAQGGRNMYHGWKRKAWNILIGKCQWNRPLMGDIGLN